MSSQQDCFMKVLGTFLPIRACFITCNDCLSLRETEMRKLSAG